MINISKIWKGSYLGRTLKDDRSFGISLIIILGLYTMVHIVKLEVFPFYMFAMYSQPEEPKDMYTTINLNRPDVLSDEQGNALSVIDRRDYRSYTYLTNTLDQYGGIVTNNMAHPESKVYDKFISRLGLSGSQLDKSFKTPYIYNRTLLDQSLNQWLNSYEINNPKGHILIKKHFTWDSDLIMLHDKTEYYELGK